MLLTPSRPRFRFNRSQFPAPQRVVPRRPCLLHVPHQIPEPPGKYCKHYRQAVPRWMNPLRRTLRLFPAEKNLSAEPTNKFITLDGTIQTLNIAVPPNQTVDTSQQDLPEFVEQIEEEIIVELPEDQHEFFPEEGISMEPIEISGREVNVSIKCNVIQ